MRKYKIVYIDDWGDWGGAQKVTLTLIKHLDLGRYEPHFILGSRGLFAQNLIKAGIPVQVVPMTPMSLPTSKRYALPLLVPKFLCRLLLYTLKTYTVVRRIQPDLIQTCSIQAKIIGSLVAKLAHVKLLWHVQTMQPLGFRRKLVHFLAGRFPDMIVATSQAVAEIYTNIVPADKLQVNHAGIDLAEFRPIDPGLAKKSLKDELGITNKKIVVSASMIRYGKGLHVLARAAAEVLKHFPDVVFLIVGEALFSKDYEYKEQLIKLVYELGLAEKFRFLGFRKDVYNIIAAADCLVHCPIEYDSLPTVVLEAMAMQTPVIGTVIGGIPEEIDDQVTGLLVEPGNEIELGRAVRQILENPGLSERFTKSARRKLESEFSHHPFVSRFEHIYAKMLNET